MGFAFGWIAPILKTLEDPDSILPLTPGAASWIASLHELGRFFGPIISGSLMDVVGRKMILIICAFLSFAIWFGVLFTKSVAILCAMRFIFGIGVGMCDVVSSIYLAENCLPKIRGIFCSVTVVFFYSGMLIQFVLASYLSYDTVALINLINGLIGVFCSLLLVEPIQFLLMKNKVVEARKNFTWLKGESDWDVINTEFDIIKKNVQDEVEKKQSFNDLCSSPNNRKSVIVVFILNILTMATGYGAVMAYITMILQPTESFTPYEFTICFGIVEVIAVIVSLFIIDRFDRRSLLQFLLFAIGVIHLWTAAMYTASNTHPSRYYPWLIFLGLGSFAFMYAILDPVIHITRGELFPQSIKAIGGCLAIMAHSSMAFTTTKLFLIVSDTFGVQYSFVIFSIASFTALVYTYCVLPEARAKSLVEIQAGDMSVRTKNAKNIDAEDGSDKDKEYKCLTAFAHCST